MEYLGVARVPSCCAAYMKIGKTFFKATHRNKSAWVGNLMFAAELFARHSRKEPTSAPHPPDVDPSECGPAERRGFPRRLDH